MCDFSILNESELMRRLLIVTSEFKYSGPNNVILSLVRGLRNENLDVHVLSLRVKNDNDYVQEINKLGAKVHVPGNYCPMIFFLLRKLIELSPDYVNTHGIRADFFCLALAFLKPFKHFATIHNVPNEDYFFRYKKIIAKGMLFTHKFIFRSRRVMKVAVSQNVKNSLIAIGGNNVAFVYNGIDETLYFPISNLQRFALCEKLNVSPDTKKVIFCGHLTPLKNPLILAEAARFLPEIDFLFLGDGPLKEELFLYGDNIKIIGRVNNVSEYLQISDCYVIPSLTEGMPMAMIEALFTNLNIISSDIPIFKELSKLSGLTMKTFSSYDVEALVDAICSLVNLKLSNNREVAINLFSSSVMARNYTHLFEY